MRQVDEFQGKTAVVTGAGQGIGLAIARKLAEAGADVVIAEYNETTGQQAVDQINQSGHSARYIKLDVRAPQSVAAMVDTLTADGGHIDLLVNNAGIVQNVAAEATPDDVWLSIIDVNLNGVFWCCRAVGRHMLERSAGTIINIASMSGMISNTPQPQAAYNASKAAVIMLTKSLAGEWARRGVRVNSISPGYIGTDLLQEVIKQSEEWSTVWHAMIPMGRVGEPDDVANAVLYLASDAAKYATGTNLVIDGGYTSW